MTARNKNYEWRPESVKLDKLIIEAMEPIMKRALKMNFALDSFYYIACNSINDMISCYASEKAMEKEENSEQEKGGV